MVSLGALEALNSREPLAAGVSLVSFESTRAIHTITAVTAVVSVFSRRAGFAVATRTAIAPAIQTVLARLARGAGQADCTVFTFGANGTTLASRTSWAMRAHCTLMT